MNCWTIRYYNFFFIPCPVLNLQLSVQWLSFLFIQIKLNPWQNFAWDQYLLFHFTSSLFFRENASPKSLGFPYLKGLSQSECRFFLSPPVNQTLLCSANSSAFCPWRLQAWVHVLPTYAYPSLPSPANIW